MQRTQTNDYHSRATKPSPATPANHRAYGWYIAGSAFWIAGMSLQGFLFSWLLVGVLERPATDVGFARTLAELPPLAILFLGGLLGDRMDGRRLLLVMHALIAIPPLLLAGVAGVDALSFSWVVAFAMLMSGLQALSDPVRQATLSRVARLDTQRAVTFMIMSTSLVGLGAFYLGGQLDRLGMPTVLVLQSSLFVAGLLATSRLPALPVVRSADRVPTRIADGLRSMLRTPILRAAIGLNFVSSLFNAGAYIVVLPYVVRSLYDGDAAFFANAMIAFTIGSTAANLILLGFMPLKHPGRLFLLLQLTRMAILAALLTQPTTGFFLALLTAWGLNMGITSTLVRTTVQELAEPALRAQVLSLLLVSFMVAAPASSLLLGWLIERLDDPLSGLMPGIALSLLIFLAGRFRSGLWHYVAPSSPRVATAT